MPKVALVAHWDWVLHHFRMPIARMLRDAGCDVVMVCPDGPHVQAFLDEGLRWAAWRVERRSVNPLREARAVAALAGVYRRERPDLVHHFTVKPNLYGSVAARLTHVPVVLNMFSGLGYVFSDDGRASRLRRAVGPLMRWSFAGEQVHMLALNEEDLQGLRKAGLATPERSRIMPEGVDLDRFRPGVGFTAEGPPTVLLACRLLHDKGVGELAAAARIVRERGIELRVQIAGEPDPGNPSSVSAHEIASWASEGLVDFLGRRTDMPELLRSADVAVLPTHYKEGAPRFLMEAAASGLPLVATDVQGCRDLVHPGINGFLIPPRSPDALADALAELAKDESLRRRLGAGSRTLAEETFGEAHVTHAHLQLYRDVGLPI
jgi:glycosyltransferase involved in cell wall biosynthesis